MRSLPAFPDPNFFSNNQIDRQDGLRPEGCTVNVKRLIAVESYGEQWQSVQDSKEVGSIECVAAEVRLYNVCRDCRERGLLCTLHRSSISSNRPCVPGTDYAQKRWSPRRSKHRGFRTGLWDGTYISSSEPCITYLCALPDSRGKEIFRAPPTRKVWVPVFLFSSASVIAIGGYA